MTFSHLLMQFYAILISKINPQMLSLLQQLIFNHHSMPYRFKIEVRKSQVQGSGVFALEDIPKGAVYWTFFDKDGTTPNQAYTKEDFESMEEEEAIKILHGGFYFPCMDCFIGEPDGSDFTNHSSNPKGRLYVPSKGGLADLKAYAITDIKAGEEITEWYPDYTSNNPQWVTNLLSKYDPDRMQFEEKLQSETRFWPHKLI